MNAVKETVALAHMPTQLYYNASEDTKSTFLLRKTAHIHSELPIFFCRTARLKSPEQADGPWDV